MRHVVSAHLLVRVMIEPNVRATVFFEGFEADSPVASVMEQVYHHPVVVDRDGI